MKFQILFILGMLFLASCSQNSIVKKEIIPIVVEKAEMVNESKGYTLLKQNCYACHNPAAASHDDLLAPPMIAVKRRYKASYDNKEDFTKAMVAWVKNPKEESAMMRGAVKNFKVMPKLPFDEVDLKLVADYIWDNELEQPTWFDAHFKEKHPDGMGHDKTMGKKKGKKGGCKGNCKH